MKKAMCMVLFCAVMASFLSCATGGKPAHEEGRHFEQAGGYSIVLPESWQATEFAGLKYKILMGQTENNFTPNITIVDEAFGGDLSFYVNAVLGQLENLLGENFELVERSDFVTLKKVKGEKLVTNTFQLNTHIRQVLYCLPGDGKKIVLTCSAPAEAGEAFDGFFDSILETFEWTK